MERNIVGELNMYRQAGTKPNFTEIARKYGMSRHTVAKYWRRDEGSGDLRHSKPSAFDEVRDLIEEKSRLPGITKKAVHEYLLDRRSELGLPGYNAFTQYCRRHDISFSGPADPEPHPRFETPPGRQLQFDWKEDLTMTDASGEVFEFNVFSATLGYSRLHKFTYAPSRTTDELLSCLLGTFAFLGGMPEEAITDNMSALVTFSGGRRIKSERAWRFAKEAGFTLRLCKPHTPQTKGKDESANRFVSRLRAYDGDFVGLEGLLAAIARIEARSNQEPCESTGLPPAVLFMREKEHLRAIGNMRLLEEMVGDVSVQEVPSTMLVRAAGRQWSVPRSCIGRKATVTTMPGGQIRVTVAGRLVAAHDASRGTAKLNYTEEHYVQALEGKAGLGDADIREAARTNLELLDRMGGGADE